MILAICEFPRSRQGLFMPLLSEPAQYTIPFTTLNSVKPAATTTAPALPYAVLLTHLPFTVEDEQEEQ